MINMNNIFQEENINTVFYFIILLAFIYSLFSYSKNRKLISIILFLFVLLYIFNEHPYFSRNIHNSKSDMKLVIVNKILKDIRETNKDLVIDNIYTLNKPPKSFMFIEKNPFIIQVIYDLRFLERFNKAEYYKLIILLEYFLKNYYKTIVEEYDYNTVFPTLLTIRKNILNTINDQVFSIPTSLNLPNIEFDIPNTDVFLNNIVKKVQAYTYKKIKILSTKNKNHKRPVSYKSPIESNTFQDMYQLF